MLTQSRLVEILREQQEEVKYQLSAQVLIQRTVLDKEKSFFDSSLVKVISGVRRCGKSILALQSAEANQKYFYINFDDDRLFFFTVEDFDTLLLALKELRPHQKYFLILDEIQNIQGWELFVTRIKRVGYNITVTGSNANLLSRELATHLTGRHLNLNLYPLSFVEYLSYFKISLSLPENKDQQVLLKKYFGTYFTEGGFPEVVSGQPKEYYLRDLFDKILTRDILLRYKIRNARQLKEVALLAISLYASKVSYQKIANALGISSVNQVQKFFFYLNEVYLIFELENFSFKVKERYTKQRKVYCIDPGLIDALGTKSSLDLGLKLENIVFLELLRRKEKFYFYSESKFEVDFVLIEDKKPKHIIQVAYSLEKLTTLEREVSALELASKSLNCKSCLILTYDEEVEIEKNGLKIKVLPVWKWLLQ